MIRKKIFSFLSQESGDREETEIPHPIHPAGAERPWLSGVGGFGFEFSFWVRARIRVRDHSGVWVGVWSPWQQVNTLEPLKNCISKENMAILVDSMKWGYGGIRHVFRLKRHIIPYMEWRARSHVVMPNPG